ncbi:MAG: MBL fold metallo-hydrolase [Pseudomonadaceae bacterium]|nr:MBL fold metallo-hydrolase [Pseudomonadaceae bacterium]
MNITQLRNATLILQVGSHRILVDPMLARKDALPPLGFFNGRRQRNPTVELPISADSELAQVTHCLITHCQKGHFDHLDRAAKKWLREQQIPVICTPHDAAYLSERGLNVQPLPEDHHNPSAFFDGTIKTVRCTHGEGLVGKFMEHGVGYLIELPGEPSLYLSGDTVMTAGIRDFVRSQQPDVSVIPAGDASLDIGGDIIMGVADVIEFARLARGIVLANHLEALSHCPVTRSELQNAALSAGIGARLRIPKDGETLEFTCAQPRT